MPKRRPSARGETLTLLRRSSASGSHGKKKKDRLNTERKAVEEDKRAD